MLAFILQKIEVKKTGPYGPTHGGNRVRLNELAGNADVALA